ncbi:hypothetical protein F5Y06DRAFT_278520 [Hypoxylon sp. FL0890]|nr:hypothetical protein F5Y06DRAFT_278520 [Hypoxylon sp. FL0890]
MPNLCGCLPFNKKTKGKKKEKIEKEGGDDELASGAQASDTELTDGIGALELFDNCRGPAEGVDLVFVHGLRGSRVKTWSQGDACWPRDFLKDDMENARGITWGYDANIANAFSFASQESIFGHAEALLIDLSNWRKNITRPIIFICHSLGGLVVEKALVKSFMERDTPKILRLGLIHDNTLGVVFMGTPHRGSSVEETYGELAVKVAYGALRQPNRQLLQTLKRDSHILEDLRTSFMTASKDLHIVCIREEVPTGAGLIVPEASASLDGANVTRGSIRANHMDMVKFRSKDAGYQRTLRFIESILDTARVKASRGTSSGGIF